MLIYIYRAGSHEKWSVPRLDCAELLIAPVTTNHLPWKHGYFETLEHRPLNDADRLPQHCCRDVRGDLYDAHSNRLSQPSEPVGVWGVSNYRTIDDDVSSALGIARTADDHRRGSV